MARALTEAEIKAFHNDGFLTPFDVYSETEAVMLNAQFEAMEAAIGDEPRQQSDA